MPDQVYPGSRPTADRLLAVIAAGRVDQPLLFVGPEGSGKEVTALDIARRCQCRQPQECRPGALCESCQKAVTFQHPDIRWLGPSPAALEDPARSDQVRQLLEAKIADPFHQSDAAASCQILIGNPDQPGPLTVRSLQQFLRRRTFQGRWKAAVIADANRLNPAAANALLKTLEEPPPDSLIMLLASSVAGLPATIRSRCQQVAFAPYGESEVLALLARLRPDASASEREEAARCAGGNVRRAIDLLTEESRRLRRWTEDLFADLCAGRTGRLQIAAELLHTGQITGEGDRNLEPVARRRQALRVCDHLAWLLAESVACRELGGAWRPRLAQATDAVRAAAGRRPTGALLQDIARIERTRHEVEGNVSLGLAMAALLQDLEGHVCAD